MAKSSPAFQFYPSDFLIGVALFTNEEIGIYIKLLCYQWVHGRIPPEPNRIARLAATSEKRALQVLSKFESDGEGFFNARLESERTKQQEYRDKQKANGYLGGRPKLTQIEPKPFENDNPEPKPEKALQSSSSNIVTTDTPPTQEAVVAYGRSPHGGIPEAVAVAFWRNFQSVGWIDAAGRKITDWKQALHKWATNQGNHGKTNRNSQRSYEPDQRVKNSTDAAREGITLKTTKF